MPLGNAEPEEWLGVREGAPQLSEATGAGQLTVCVQPGPVILTVIFEQPVITGGILSTTVTVNEHVAILAGCILSSISHRCRPLGNAKPEGWLGVREGTPQLSEAMGAGQLTVCVQPGPVILTVIFEQPVITGGILSTTVTVNEHVAHISRLHPEQYRLPL